MKKLISMMLAVAMLLSLCPACADGNSPADLYSQAWQKAEAGEFAYASVLFESLGDYEDSAELAYLLGVSAYADRMTFMGDTRKIAYRFHGQWGLINLQEKALVAPTWDSITELNHHGLAMVSRDGLYGYVNAKGESVIDCVWTNVSSFSGDLCTVQQGSGSAARYGLMNAQGVEVTPAMWREIGGSRGGYILAPVFMHGRIAVRNGDGYGLMDETGTVRGDICWEEAPDLRNVFPMVKKNNRYGFINLDGVVVVPVTYRQAMDFSDGLAAVSSDGRLWGFVDPTGAVVVPQVYEQVQPYSGSVAHVKQPGMHWQIIDSTGQLVYFVTDQICADYDAAMALVAQEDYEGAAELLAGTIGYRDSYTQLLEARRLAPLKDAYNASVTYLVRGQYREAIASLRQASGYKDADAKRATLEENVYQKGVSLMAAEDYTGAASWFGIVTDYKDAAAQAAACNRLAPLKAAYDKGVAYLAEGKYKDAIASFGKASGYKDADDQKAAAQETVYQKGMSLMAAEDYAGAASWFGIVPSYKDAAAQVGECTRLKPLKAAYDQGVAYLAEGKYKEAIAAFSNATGYKDADNQKAAVQEIVYQKGMSLMAVEDYTGAASWFGIVPGYKDAAAQAAACSCLAPLKAAYDQAVAFLAEGKYKEAIASFGKASGYKDADDQKAAAQETVYQKGVSLMAAEDYTGAASWFGIVPGYKDAAAQVGECTRLKPLKAAYDQGVAYLAEGKYKEAIAAFSNATGFKDADDQKAAVQEIVYQKGVEALMAGDRQMAGEYLVMVMEYKDASELLAEAGIAGVRVRNIGSYGFVLNEDGFYESTNQGVPDSYAMCEVTFSTSTGVVYIDYINRGQARRDYGIVSQLDCTLIRSATADKQNVLLDLSGKNSPVIKSYPIYVPDDGEHTITIKYIKDGSGNQFEDSLQFRIRFE